MKQILLLTLLLGFSGVAHATENCDNETRFTGAAAVELYDSLNIPETPISDQHGGSTFANGKFGKLVGCQKSLDGNATECWIIQPFTGRNCD